MNAAIKDEVKRRGITRICHFTPSRNLVHIASGTQGILGTRQLRQEEREVFTPTDLQRLDQHTEAVSCSIEYPNSWYFDKARARDAIFRDWVILLIDPAYLWQDGTLFCPRNAAAEFGRTVKPGLAGFQELYSPSVVGAYGKTFQRSARHLTSCPTDEQAEVLVPDAIQWKDVFGLAVVDKQQASREYVRLQMLHVALEGLQIVIAPVLYDKYGLSNYIRSGKRPPAVVWTPT